MQGKSNELAEDFLIFQNEDVVVINKSNDLLVHHSHYARNIREESLTQQLRAAFKEIYPVHRLDRKTSGVMVFGRTKEAAKYLQQQFESGTISKTYLALVRGHTENSGKVDSPIRSVDSDDYKEALTYYKTLYKTEVDIPVDPYPTSRYSLIELQPKTGRTHQLRKHMNKIAHPIIGDPKYGNRHHNQMFQERFGHARLYLHAYSIEFELLSLGQKKFKAELPTYWEVGLTKLNFDQPIFT